MVFFGCGNKSCPGIIFFLKIGRKSICEDGKANLEVRRWGVAAVSNLHWRCQGQELPVTPRKALFFGNGALWKAPGGGVVKNCSTEFVKSKVFRWQEAHFEGCTFPMWRACRPQTKKSRSRKLQIATHEFSLGASDI